MSIFLDGHRAGLVDKFLDFGIFDLRSLQVGFVLLSEAIHIFEFIFQLKDFGIELAFFNCVLTLEVIFERQQGTR